MNTIVIYLNYKMKYLIRIRKIYNTIIYKKKYLVLKQIKNRKKEISNKIIIIYEIHLQVWINYKMNYKENKIKK